MTRPPKGVLLDLDDTLYPQGEFLAQAWDEVAAAGAARGLDEAALRAALGRAAAAGSDRGGLIDEALAEVSPVAAQSDPDLAPALVSVFRSFRPTALTPYRGTARRLATLAGYLPLVLVTDGNPAQQRAKLAATGLAPMLSGVVCTDEDGGRAGRKPHPSGFLKGLSLLGCGPEDAVMVGDRPDKDVAGATALGVRALRVRQGEYRERPDPAGVWRTAAGTAEALDLLIGLCEGRRG